KRKQRTHTRSIALGGGALAKRHVCRPRLRRGRHDPMRPKGASRRQEGAARPARGDGGPGAIGGAERGEAARAPDGPPGGQCPAFTSAATVNQSSVTPAFSP